MRRPPDPCFIHSAGLTARSFCPFQSFLNRSDFRFPSDMENAFGTAGRKQVDRIIFQATESELTSQLAHRPDHIFPYFASQGSVLLVYSQAVALWDLKARKLPPIGF